MTRGPIVSKDAVHSATIERLYVLNGGFAVAPDRSVYSPGMRQGEQVTLSRRVARKRPVVPQGG